MQKLKHNNRPNQKVKRKNVLHPQFYLKTHVVLSDVQVLANRLTGHQRKLWAKADYAEDWLKSFFSDASGIPLSMTDVIVD